ncbi:MAG: hypothetical protein ACXU68_03470 [Croceibacterium sp.]
MSRRGMLAVMLLAVAPLPLVAATKPEPTTQARVRAFARLPYWSGYWVSEAEADISIGGTRSRDSKAKAPDPANSLAIWANAAPWNNEGRRRLAESLRTMGGRKGMGWGFPLMMTAPTPLQFLITPEEVLIVNAYDETRHIYTDGRPMPPLEDLWPTVTGTSIGHWEGRALVIDTIQVTNPNVFFQGGPPLSEEARYHERIWLDGDKLRAQVTIEDPVTLTRPWTVTLSWIREKAFDRMVQVDWSNDRTGSKDGLNTIEPPAGEEKEK